MTSPFGIPYSYKSRQQQSILNLIPGCSFSLRRPFVNACRTRDSAAARPRVPLLPFFLPLFFFCLPSLKSIELIFPTPTLKTSCRRWEPMRGPKLTAIGRSHSLAINAWANSSQNKSGTRVYSSAHAQTRSPSETRIILHVLLHLGDIA